MRHRWVRGEVDAEGPREHCSRCLKTRQKRAGVHKTLGANGVVLAIQSFRRWAYLTDGSWEFSRKVPPCPGQTLGGALAEAQS